MSSFRISCLIILDQIKDENKKIYLFLLLVLTASIISAQTINELRAIKATKAAKAADFQSKADAVKGEIAGIDAQITELIGWTISLNGTVDFDFANSDMWQANPNPNAASSSLGLVVMATASKDQAKYFWYNKGIFQKAWQDVDITVPGATEEDDDLFDQGTVDIINISSLAGFKLSPKLALSALGELNTSLGNFLEPGTADLGIGATWLPIKGMAVVIHPLNYHMAWNNLGDLQSDRALGAKIRIDCGRNFMVMRKKVGWSTTFTSYQPYSNPEESVTLQEYTWLSALNFEVWRGVGLGIIFGLRQADFETFKEGITEEGVVQKFYQVGLNYGF